MNNKINQWEKRVILFQYVYSQLIKNDPISIAKQNFATNFLDIDSSFIAVLEYCLDNKENIIKEISKFIPKNWNFNRLNLVDQANLLAIYSESKVLGTEKNILIDQAIITSKKYSDLENYEYINAILDKVL